jgi:hypothetical protein
MAKMSNATYLQYDLFPGVVSALLKNNDETIIKIVREQYFANTEFADSKSFVSKFSQVLIVLFVCFRSCTT